MDDYPAAAITEAAAAVSAELGQVPGLVERFGIERLREIAFGAARAAIIAAIPHLHCASCDMHACGDLDPEPVMGTTETQSQWLGAYLEAVYPDRPPFPGGPVL